MIRIFVSILCVAIAGGIFVIYTRPAYDRVTALQAENAQYDQALDKSKELQELKRSLLSRYNAFTPQDLDRLHKLLPDHVDNVRLVLDLDSMAARYGMALQNVIISNPADRVDSRTIVGAIGAGSEPYDSLTLRFATQGTYSSFVRFMEDLESSLRIVDLEELGLELSSAQPPGGTEPIYRYTLTVRTYWLK